MAFGDLKGTLSGSSTATGSVQGAATGGPFQVAVGDLIYALVAEQTSSSATECIDSLNNIYLPLPVADAGSTVTGRAFWTRVTNGGFLSTVTFITAASNNNIVALAAAIEGPFQAVPRQSLYSGDAMAANLSFAKGNNRVTAVGSYGIAAGTIRRSSGKSYCEFNVVKGTALDAIAFGVVNTTFTGGSFIPGTTFLGMTGNTSLGWGYSAGGSVFRNGSVITSIQSFTQGDTVCMAVDHDNRTVWFRTNGGLWNNSSTANPSTNVGGIDVTALGATLLPAVENDLIGNIVEANFGQNGFAQSVPSGFGYWDTLLDQNPGNIVNDNTTPYTCPATGTVFVLPGSPVQEVLMCWAVQTGNVTLTATSPNTKSVQLNTAGVLTAAIGRQAVTALASTAPAWTSSGTPTESAYGTTSFRREFYQSFSVGLLTDSDTLSAPTETVWFPSVTYPSASPLYRHRRATSSEVISPASIKVQFAAGSVNPLRLSDSDSFFAPNVVGGLKFESYAASSPLIRYRFRPYSEAIIPLPGRVPGFLNPNLISDSDNLFGPNLGGAVGVSLSFITDTDSVYSVSLLSSYQLLPGIVTDSESLRIPALSATYNIQPALLDDVNTLYSVTITGVGQALPQIITDTDSFSTPSVVRLSTQNLTPVLFSDSDILYVTTVTQAGFVSPILFASADTVYAPVVGAIAPPFSHYARSSPLIVRSRFIPPMSVTEVRSRPIGIYPGLIYDVDTLISPDEVEGGYELPTYTGGDKPSLILHSKFIPPMSVTIVVVTPILRLDLGLLTDNDSFFSVTVTPAVGIGLITDGDSFFNPGIARYVSPTLLVDTDFLVVTPSVFSTYAISITVSIVDSENLFILGVNPGAVNITPSSVPVDADNLLAPAVSQPPLQALVPGTLPDIDILNIPAVGAGTVNVNSSVFTDNDILFSQALTLNVSTTRITDIDALIFGIRLELFLLPDRIIDVDNFSVPTTTVGDVNVSLTLLSDVDTLFISSLIGGGAQAVVEGVFTDADNLYIPQLMTGSVNIGPGLFTDLDTVFNSGLVSNVDLLPNRFVDTDSLFSPLLGISLAISKFTDQDFFFAPSQQIAVTPTLFTAADTVFAPGVFRGLDVFPGVFADADAFFAPSISGTVTLSPSKFTDADALFMAALSGNVVPATFTDSDTFFVPTLKVGMSSGLLIDSDIFYPPSIVYPQTTTIQLLRDQDLMFVPVVLLPPHEPTYDYPIEHSLGSDYGKRKSRLRRGRYIIGR